MAFCPIGISMDGIFWQNHYILFLCLWAAAYKTVAPALTVSRRGRSRWGILLDRTGYLGGQCQYNKWSMAQLIHRMCPERKHTDHHALVRQRLNAKEWPHMPNPAKLVHWLKLSRGSTMETRGSYGIKTAGSAQNNRKITLVDGSRWS